MTVTSAPDQGSTFTLHLPVASRRGRPTPALMAQVAGLPAKRVLLVEDEPGLVLTLTDRLNSEGYVVASATDGPSGLAHARRAIRST